MEGGEFCLPLSVTRWFVYLFNFWPFTTVKICPVVRKWATQVQYFAKNLANPLRVAKDFYNCTKVDEISPNQVTLLPFPYDKQNFSSQRNIAPICFTNVLTTIERRVTNRFEYKDVQL